MWCQCVTFYSHGDELVLQSLEQKRKTCYHCIHYSATLTMQSVFFLFTAVLDSASTFHHIKPPLGVSLSGLVFSHTLRPQTWAIVAILTSDGVFAPTSSLPESSASNVCALTLMVIIWVQEHQIICGEEQQSRPSCRH